MALVLLETHLRRKLKGETVKNIFRLVLFGVILSAGSTFASQFDMPVPMPVCPPTGPCVNSSAASQFDMPVPMPVCPPTGPCSSANIGQ
jgi:hypothetical protein